MALVLALVPALGLVPGLGPELEPGLGLELGPGPGLVVVLVPELLWHNRRKASQQPVQSSAELEIIFSSFPSPSFEMLIIC